jgi:hypothetical protein
MTNPLRGAVLLGVVAIIGLLGAILLAATDHNIPAELWAITFAAVTGAAGVTVPAHVTTTRRDGS